MNVDIQKGLEIGAEAVAAGKIEAMGKKLSTRYEMEAYRPWHIDEVVKQLGKQLLPRRKIQKLVENGVDRFGELFIPITTIFRVVPNLPEELKLILYGDPIWVAGFNNLVTTVGLNDSLTQHFKGSSYTAAWYVGLTAATPTFANGDTASSHGGWTELTAYSESVRQTLTLGTASGGSIDNSASKAAFTINANSTTIGGAFLITVSTKSGTTGTLYGGGALSVGNKTLDSADVLNVTLTLTAS